MTRDQGPDARAQPGDLRGYPTTSSDGSFGRWLEGARDWSVSRNRFWGSPIPVWKSDDPAYPRIDVYGSIAELERRLRRARDRPAPACDRRAGATEPRRPHGRVDDAAHPRRARLLVRVGVHAVRAGPLSLREPASGSSRTTRVTSSSSTSARRAAGSTRMHVLATALFDKPAFQTCLVHGVLLGDDGQKLSKRLRNYPDPGRGVRHDRLRRHALGAAVVVRGARRRHGRGRRRVRCRRRSARCCCPIWNAWYFLSLYANAGGMERGEPRRVVGRGSAPGAAGETADAGRARPVRPGQDAYQLVEVGDLPHGPTTTCRAPVARSHEFLDSLNNWYIRRSRQRFWDERPDRRRRAPHGARPPPAGSAAPLLPLLTEKVWGDLTGDVGPCTSTDWPDPAAAPRRSRPGRHDGPRARRGLGCEIDP